MSGDALQAHAERFLSVATRHGECLGGRIAEVTDADALIELDLNVEMPLHMKVDGVAQNGVRRTETVTAVLRRTYPWSSPSFFLRPDFPRDLPHLQPDPPDTPPRPCLVDGNQREYFFQFGLVEAGVFHLVHQLVLWLQRAAEGTLIDEEQGWEPALRRDLSHLLVMDAEACRALVDRDGGYRVLKAGFHRSGGQDTRLSNGAGVIVQAGCDAVPLKRGDKELLTSRCCGGSTFGNTVCCVIWPDKLASGAAFVSDRYMPETVTTLDALRHRAEELGCRRGMDAFVNSLERCLDGYVLGPPVPITIVLCARRPFHLIGSRSEIELLPYIVEVRAAVERGSLFAAERDEPAAPAMQLDVASPALLRLVSGAPEAGPVAMLGCGSVGSKMAVHLARSGVDIVAVSDRGILLPHNMARHALARSALAASKATELARELGHLGQSPQVQDGDLVVDLTKREERRGILPKAAVYAVNTTAALGVRETLSSLLPVELKPRLAEAALFGLGRGAFLLVEGVDHNPMLCDLVAELYATVSSARLRRLLFDRAYGLSEVQIGQGCSSLTMPMTDMRLSAMTAGLSEALLDTMQLEQSEGRIIVGETAEAGPDSTWSGIVTLTPWLRHGRCFIVSECARYLTVVTAFRRSSSSMPSGCIAVSR